MLLACCQHLFEHVCGHSLIEHLLRLPTAEEGLIVTDWLLLYRKEEGLRDQVCISVRLTNQVNVETL